MDESLLAYVPMDRLRALSRGESLPERTQGSALFADISGFTPLTEALVRELGPQRGAEELTGFLNEVYDTLVDQLHHWGGSAIAFAGDAVTCWFDGDDGLSAVACALSMQGAMGAFAAVTTPKGTVIELSMKAAVAVGPARRFLVGDPQSRVVEALAGATLERLAAAEHEANRGEVILAPCACSSLAERVEVADIRVADDGRRFCVIRRLTVDPQTPELPDVAIENLDEEEIRSWLLPAVYRRLDRGMGDFLAEIRETVAVFVRFSGIDYDEEEDAGEKLDAIIRAVQDIVDRYEGTMIDLNIGDKGSYLYVNFGAPLTHENNVARAASAALEMRDLPETLTFMDPLQIGVTQGRMRAGAYGGTAHRTYGVLGDAVNLSARLMMASQPGTVLASGKVQEQIAESFEWEILEPIRVKGKSEPQAVAVLKAVKPRIGMHLPDDVGAEPLVGRDEEVALLAEAMRGVLEGKGHIISIVGEAGLGKSRMVAKALSMARERGFEIYGGEAESHGVNSSYLVWHPIWRGILGVDPTRPQALQISRLRQRLGAVDENMVQRLPLLGPALQLSIKDNELTSGLDAKLRKSLLESLLVEILADKAAERPLLLVLEDCHWLDALSYDLMDEVARRIENLPVLIIRTYRDMGLEGEREAPASKLAYHSSMELTPLTQDDLTKLAAMRLERIAANGRDAGATEMLARRIAVQAEGNPFYLEELVNYVGSEASGVDADELSDLALPSSLQGLVLSRLDQLAERPKTVLKVASVVGRVFHASWLKGIYPELGGTSEIVAYMQELCRQNFTVDDPSNGEDTYYFRNIITRGVIYDSLLHKMRTALHEKTGIFLEATYADEPDQFLDLLAYHFDHSPNVDKRRYYLRRAGEFAQRTYANRAALSYYRKVLPLLPPEDHIDILLRVGEVEKLVGQWNGAMEVFEEALTLSEATGHAKAIGRSYAAIAEMQRNKGNFAEAISSLEYARIAFDQINDQAGLAQVLQYSGIIAAQQGDLDEAEARFKESLEIRRAIDDQRGVANLLNNLMIIAEYRGELEIATSYQEEALAIRREVGDQRMIAISLSNLGNILQLRGELAAARERLEESIELQRGIGDRWYLGNALNNLGNVVRKQGSYREARQLYAESLAICRELGDGWATAYLLEDVGRLLHLQKQQGDALALFGAAEALRERIDAPLPPPDHEALDELTLQIEVDLGPAFSKECLEGGKTMSMNEAIDFALTSVAGSKLKG